MRFWENIVQTAMLGTNKKGAAEDDLPEDMFVAVKSITTNEALDAEEKFLQTAALAYNYRQGGVMPDHKPDISLPPAPTEENPYCSAKSVQALKDILFEESTGLLKIWLTQCKEKEQIVVPALVPALLDKSLQHKQLKSLVQTCAGNRGMWLSQFNNDWTFGKATNAEALWQTGTPAERKNVLEQLRKTEPAKARAWLQQTWAVENAATKTDLLGIFSANLSGDDIVFLENLLNEKSQKVKDQVIDLLKKIPSSAIVQKYQGLLSQAVTLKKERALLGLSSKIIIHFNLPGTIDENIFKSGIEKLSNRKEFSDDEFVLYQVMQFVPPTFWEQQFSLTASEIINLFQKDEAKKKFIPALVIAALQFKDTQWAIAFMQYAQTFYIDIIPMLPLQQQDFYSNKFFTGNEESIIHYALQRDEEWSIELAKNILKHTAKNQYNYNRSFYNQHIHKIPLQVVGILENCTPQEEHLRGAWHTTSEYITKLITLKIQTIKAFQ